MQLHQHDRESDQTPRAARPTIGLLFPDTNGPHNPMWLGARDTARRLGVNLIFLEGAELGNPFDFKEQGNVLYDLVNRARIDGLILWTLDLFSTREQMQQFAESYRSLPMVSVETVLDGIPSLLMDNITGMAEIVSHLIEVHGSRRIAFLRGPSSHLGAEERYQSYVATLAAHGLPLDPQLISPPPKDWSRAEAAAMMRRLLDERQVDFEAVMAANDGLALGALSALQGHGLRVPGDVAVAGFDNNLEAIASTPPLTTVRPPFYELGVRAVEMILAQMRGEVMPELVSLPAELVIRRSCGCLSPAVARAAAGPIRAGNLKVADGQTVATAVAEQRAQILAELEHAVGTHEGMVDPSAVAQLLDAFLANLDGHAPGRFLAALEDLAIQTVSTTNSGDRWHQFISILRQQLLPYLAGTERALPAEDLWHQAHALLAELTQRAEIARNLQAEERAQAFRELGQALITTFDVAELMDVVAHQLPRLGIERCYLSLYDDPHAPTGRARLILAYDEHGRHAVPPTGHSFLAPHLVPDELWDPARLCSMVVEPLYFQDQQLGLVLFEAGPRDGWVYAVLRGQLSSALKGALLAQQEKRALADMRVAQSQTQKLATELATVAEVSTVASTLLEGGKLLQTVVDLTKTSFGLAHVHIYLLNPAGDALVLVAGAGEVGQQLVAEGWSIPLSHESSLAAQAARTQRGGMVNNAQTALDRLPTHRLPNTQAELAVPLVVGAQVLGVLDVHADTVDRFTPDDLRIQSTLAAQVAVAIQNAWLYREAAEARHAAEEANEFKTKFIANMSHELRTPLNAILNFTRFLSKPRYGSLTERQQELQERMLANAEHLLGLINDILDLAKIETGRMDLFPEDVDLLPLLRGVMATSVGLTKDKGLELTLDAPEVMPLLRIDKTRVRQVLLNLLSNAAKFTERGGITLQVNPIANGMICIAVRDTGLGIAPENQALIFEEYRQIDGALNRQYQGTGLGLPISKRLVEMHSGTMWLESTLGVGSTFSFTLPIALVAGAEAGMAAAAEAAAGLVPVVVVDNDQASQDILRDYLESAGYRVHMVLDSRQALTTIQQIRPALVLLDVEMPHLDGWHVLAQLRTNPMTAALPVMICSVVDQQQLGIALGATAHLVKPIREAELLELVQRYTTPSATVLVIDDQPDARQVILDILDGRAYQVIEASDGAAGLAAAQEFCPDLIILDLMLPKLDGFELLAQLRAQATHADRPVIVVSAKDLTPDEQGWLHAHAQHTIHKHQLSASEFLACVQRLTREEPPHEH
jgi:signal transduction histidine kinase/DNA-binding LacI/PurR family transcriptional regulator/DNA-binding response OmpR family regulator